MKSVLIATALVTLVFSTMSCSHKATENDLAVKVSQQAPVAGSNELRTEAAILIEDSKLNPVQKTQLQTLHLNTSRELETYRQESLKLRSILIKDVFAKNYNKAEVKLIQNKMKKLEERRLALLFSTIDKANGIFGRVTKAEEDERIMDRMMGENRNF